MLNRKNLEKLRHLSIQINDSLNEPPTNKNQRRDNQQLSALQLLVVSILEQDTPLTHYQNDIEELFNSRWEMIQNKYHLRYDINPSSPANQCYIIFAQICAQYIYSRQYPKINFYQLLFPSLTILEDIFGQSIDDFNLNEIIIVGDEYHTFLSIKDCLSYAIHNENIEYTLLHTSLVGDHNYERLELSTEEIKLLKAKSTSISGIVDKLINLSQKLADELATLGQLNKLYIGLKQGDVNHQGSEHDSSTTANLAVVQFSLFFEQLPEDEKERLLSLEVEDETAVCDNFAELWDMIQYRVYESSENMPTVSCLALLGDVLMQLIQNNLSQLNPDQIKRYQDKLSKKMFDYLEVLPTTSMWVSELQREIQTLPQVTTTSGIHAATVSEVSAALHSNTGVMVAESKSLSDDLHCDGEAESKAYQTNPIR